MNLKPTCALALLLWTAAGSLPAADETLNQLYEEAKASFESGDLEMANYLIGQVQAADPRHKPSQVLALHVKAAMPPDGVSLKKKYSTVVLPNINMADATLDECLQALTIMARNASDGRVKTNFIIQAKDKTDAKVTLSVKQVPLPVAIDYVARIAGVKAKWEKHAVVFSSAP